MWCGDNEITKKNLQYLIVAILTGAKDVTTLLSNRRGFLESVSPFVLSINLRKKIKSIYMINSIKETKTEIKLF